MGETEKEYMSESGIAHRNESLRSILFERETNIIKLAFELAKEGVSFAEFMEYLAENRDGF